MSINERMREAYDQIAPAYTAQYGVPDPIVLDCGTCFLRLVRPGARILDVGCGPGQYMAWMESCGMEVVGVDLSAGMLAQAKDRVRGALLQMDMRRLAFPDGYFHGIWCVASLLHLPKEESPLALKEMWRAIMPGGALLLNVQEGAGEGWEDNRYFGTVQRFYARYTQDEIEKMLANAGFALLGKGRNDSPPHMWLQFLATKPKANETP